MTAEVAAATAATAAQPDYVDDDVEMADATEETVELDPSLIIPVTSSSTQSDQFIEVFPE